MRGSTPGGVRGRGSAAEASCATGRPQIFPASTSRRAGSSRSSSTDQLHRSGPCPDSPPHHDLRRTASTPTTRFACTPGRPDLRVNAGKARAHPKAGAGRCLFSPAVRRQHARRHGARGHRRACPANARARRIFAPSRQISEGRSPAWRAWRSASAYSCRVILRAISGYSDAR